MYSYVCIHRIYVQISAVSHPLVGGNSDSGGLSVFSDVESTMHGRGRANGVVALRGPIKPPRGTARLGHTAQGLVTPPAGRCDTRVGCDATVFVQLKTFILQSEVSKYLFSKAPRWGSIRQPKNTKRFRRGGGGTLPLVAVGDDKLNH